MYLVQLRLALTNTHTVTVQLNIGKSTRNQKKDKKEKIYVMYGLFTSSAEIIAQGLEGSSKQLKQIIQIAHNIVKNPSNWLEVNQLAIFKRGRCDLNSGPP